MKKLFLFLSVFGLLFACNDPDMVQPQKKGNLGLNSEEVDPTTFSFVQVVPNGLYIADGNRCWGVHTGTGVRQELISDNFNDIAMAHANGYLYSIHPPTANPTNNYLRKIDVHNTNTFTNGAPSATWVDTDAMTSYGNNLYVVDEGTLYQINTTNGAVDQFSDYPTGWENTQGMAAIGGYIYAVQGGTLYRITISNGDVIAFSDYPTGWTNTETMAAGGSYLYIIEAGILYRVTLSNGDVIQFSDYPTGWENTKGMAYVAGYLFAVQGNALWRVNTSNGDVIQFGSDSWSSTTALSAWLP